MHSTKIRPVLLGTLVATLLFGHSAPASAAASSALWRDVGESSLGRPAGGRVLAGSNHRILAADRQSLMSFLADAPMETFGAARNQGLVLELPMPRGGFQRFNVVESPIMEPSLAVQFPEIKTYRAQGLDDPTATARLDVTPQGFHAMIIGESETVYIDPYSMNDPNHYISYLKSDFSKTGAKPFQCEVKTGPSHPLEDKAARGAGRAANGTTLRTYRIAVSATGEYTAFQGGTVLGAQAAITTTINRNTGIYERDLAVRFTLVNAPSVIYTDAATDPFVNSSADIDKNTGVLDAAIGSAAYDIGHVFQNAPGGVAYLGSVCNPTEKGGGVTGTNSPTGDPFDVDYVAHEIGHQFGGNHSFNGTASACSTRNAGTAAEVGSGSSILAYAGICGVENVATRSHDNFHSVTLDEAQAFITDTSPGGGGTCGTATATGNTPPAVSAGASYTIPQGTPFALTATGSDANSDTLTYSWEQRDLGTASSTAATAQTDDGTRPLFRAYPPVSSPTRLFPKLSDVLGTTVVSTGTINGETMPVTSRAMKFHVTARDNRSGGGGTNDANTTITVSTLAGPFRVTSHSSATTVAGSSSQTVTWEVANTTAAPVNCANVAIAFSTDRGVSFTDLLSSTANDGTENVTMPNTNTTQGRFRVSCVGNVFFHISQADITVNAATMTVSVNSPTLSEGQTAKGIIAFAVTLSSALSTAVTVNYATADGTATAGADYVAASGTFTIPAGSTTKNVVVIVNADTTVEPDETFTLTLSSPTGGAALGTAVGTGTIQNDDPGSVATSMTQYRLYSPITLEHLYTTDLNEYNTLGTFVGTWVQEGVAYRMLTNGTYNGVATAPLFRLYHPGIKQHHWTTDSNEAATLAVNTSWFYEGIVGYVVPSAGSSGTTPLYRMALASPPLHIWTTDQNEYDTLATRGWTKEGIIGYVIP
jgi:hypothetical protein